MRKGEKVRQRIVAVANELFYHNGYLATSFSQIAEACEIPKGNFYYYFKSKDEILQAVIEIRLVEIAAQLKGWDADYPQVTERLKRFTRMLCNEEMAISRYGCPMGSLNIELGKSQLLLQQEARRMFDLFRDWLAEQFRQARVATPEALAMTLLAQAQGVAVLAQAYGDTEFLRREVKRIDCWLDQLLV